MEDTSGGKFSRHNLRSRHYISVPERYSFMPDKERCIKKSLDDNLVLLFRLKKSNIGVSICRGRFGKTGLLTCVASVLVGRTSSGIKSCMSKAEVDFEIYGIYCTSSRCLFHC